MSVDKQAAANELTQLVKERIGAMDWTQIKCPREKSYMSPCIARDGALALADDNVCVLCGEDPDDLLIEEKAKHQ